MSHSALTTLMHNTHSKAMAALKQVVSVAMLPTAQQEDAPPAQAWSRVGTLLVIGGFGGFLLWAATCSLAGGTYAGGMVRLAEEKQVVAHMESGIIRKILVQEGSTVTAGQELAVLDDYNSDTNLAILQKKRWELMARKARLEAVRDNSETLILPPEWGTTPPDELTDILANQTRQFNAERVEIAGQKAIITQQQAQYEAMIDSLKTQIKSGKNQIDLINQEASGVEILVQKGLERKPRLLGLQRQREALDSQNADFAGRIASYEQKITEIKLQIVNLESDRRTKAVTELAQVEAELNQTNAQWSNATTRSRELTLRAAIDGTVLNLRYRNEGSIIPREQPIMDIVPSQKVFVVDVKVSPMDIDVVHAGQKSEVRLSGLKQRTHVILNGMVLRVSPDALQDERSGQTYFEARIALDDHDPEFKKLMENGDIYAGMPAEVIMIAEERTMLQYLIQPITDSFYRSFHQD